MKRAGTLKALTLTIALGALVLAPAADAVKTNGKTVALSLSCTGSPNSIFVGPYGDTTYAGTGCTGSVTLKTKTKPKGKRKRKITLGSGNFSIKRGQTATVNVTLSAKGRRALRRVRRFRRVRRVKASVVISSTAAISGPARLTISLKKKRRR